MSHAFGWWDFVAGPPAAMVNRFSGERVAMGGALAAEDAARAVAAHPDTAAGPWMRFDYLHDDFRFPLAVLWRPAEGRIVIDHDLSAAIWRRETDADTAHPPYGGWVRVDDIVPDAFWCWPGHLKYMLRTDGAEGPPLLVSTHGGWYNARWRPNVVAVQSFAHCAEYGDSWITDYGGVDFARTDAVMGRVRTDGSEVAAAAGFVAEYERSFQSPRSFASAVNTPAPDPWVFRKIDLDEFPELSWFDPHLRYSKFERNYDRGIEYRATIPCPWDEMDTLTKETHNIDFVHGGKVRVCTDDGWNRILLSDENTYDGQLDLSYSFKYVSSSFEDTVTAHVRARLKEFEYPHVFEIFDATYGSFIRHPTMHFQMCAGMGGHLHHSSELWPIGRKSGDIADEAIMGEYVAVIRDLRDGLMAWGCEGAKHPIDLDRERHSIVEPLVYLGGRYVEGGTRIIRKA